MDRTFTLFRVTRRQLIAELYGHTWQRAIPLQEAEKLNKHVRKPERGLTFSCLM